MIDSNKLKEKIAKSNYDYKEIANILNLTESRLMNKIENKSELYASEIQGLIDILTLSLEEIDEIFFKQFKWKNNLQKRGLV